MLKFQYAINLGLALVLGVPAVTLGVQANEPLEVTLRRTIDALDQLASIEERLHERDASAIHDVLRATEAPVAVNAQDPGADDQLLGDLRQQVESLQREVGELERVAPLPTVRVPSPHLVTEDFNAPPSTPTVGLDDSARRLLASAPQVGKRVNTGAPVPTDAVSTTSDKRAFEPEGYAADAVTLGRAYYRQGRFDQALATFETAGKNADALYWRARSLEKLARNADALAAYAEVLALPDGGAAAERAKEDLEFLRWRIDFETPKARGGKPL
jgi:tetratricopeptide (TPR) repeat protein